MRKFLYAGSLVVGFWYLFSPFILKTAAWLPSRGVGVLLGTYLIIVAWNGFKRGGNLWARLLIVGAVVSIVWGVVSARLFDHGSMMHDVLVGLLLIFIARSIVSVDEGGPALAQDSKYGTVHIANISAQHGTLVCACQDEAGERTLELSSQEFGRLLSNLDFETIKAMLGMMMRRNRKPS